MKKFIFISLLFVFSCSKKIDWKDINSIEIIKHNAKEKVPDASKKEIIDIIILAKITKEKFLWKGFNDIVLTNGDKKEFKIRASGYGNFFYCFENESFYIIPKESISAWNSLVFK
ncbi:hypothetical protein ACOSP6_15865 [Tenacibaculum sp. MEBiC06402]|uniref:hypothetical protein n=1 Tax=unclassified Tenacibaculum TaxID=2635139 RepID=UPI003B9C6541